MKDKRLWCPLCGSEISPEFQNDLTKDSGHHLLVEVDCQNRDCGAESLIQQD